MRRQRPAPQKDILNLENRDLWMSTAVVVNPFRDQQPAQQIGLRVREALECW
ncbi:MAG: hypothetical protein PVH80_09090 [Anaerolineae bacterium]